MWLIVFQAEDDNLAIVPVRPRSLWEPLCSQSLKDEDQHSTYNGENDQDQNQQHVPQDQLRHLDDDRFLVGVALVPAHLLRHLELAQESIRSCSRRRVQHHEYERSLSCSVGRLAGVVLVETERTLHALKPFASDLRIRVTEQQKEQARARSRSRQITRCLDFCTLLESDQLSWK